MRKLCRAELSHAEERLWRVVLPIGYLAIFACGRGRFAKNFYGAGKRLLTRKNAEKED